MGFPKTVLIPVWGVVDAYFNGEICGAPKKMTHRCKKSPKYALGIPLWIGESAIWLFP